MATEKRLIDANALQLEPDPWGGMNGVLFVGRGNGKMVASVQAALKRMIDNAPTVDAVEVVRCKECKYWQESVDGVHKWCPLLMDKETKADDFCSYGERRVYGN